MLHVQSGTFSNYVGAHYWNICDESCDENSAGPLYTFDGRPNLFFLESSLQMGPVGFPGRPNLAEVGPGVHVVEQEQLAVHEYQIHLSEIERDPTKEPRQDFDWESVRFWSDFWKTRAFPDCKQILPPSENLEKFFWWESTVDLEDSQLRLAMERMDSIKAVSMTLDTAGGFAGASLGYAELISDELSRKSVVEFLPSEKQIDDNFLVNFAKFYDSTASFATIFPLEATEEISRFSSSAIFGAQVYTICSDHISRLNPGLAHTEFSWGKPLTVDGGEIFKKNFSVPIPFPQNVIREPGYPDVTNFQVEAAVFDHHKERRNLLLKACKALENFKISGKLRKTEILEVDDWAALEEALAEAADEDKGAAEDESDDSIE